MVMQYYAVPTIKYNAVFKEKWFMFVDKKRKKSGALFAMSLCLIPVLSALSNWIFCFFLIRNIFINGDVSAQLGIDLPIVMT